MLTIISMLQVLDPNLTTLDKIILLPICCPHCDLLLETVTVTQDTDRAPSVSMLTQNAQADKRVYGIVKQTSK